ncbi:hypothetical protein [Pimelobacter simplex]|uniref:hypothetical protein n=1 Tax=Nocardioides simplex TaxID=2045 RepID=UPI00214FC028|nr:hypothetical protein [Pimelobacter simplex]UUW90862.1 hypothetical protein M0M43_05070 [Pimelobacter simplex]UUW94691.1 hypothetical protein M0M48_23575 [Pimelobacter simplex]
MWTRPTETPSPGRIAGVGAVALAAGLLFTLMLADEAGATGSLLPMFLVAALAGGALAWVNEVVEDGRSPRRLAAPVLLLLVAVGGLVGNSLSEGNQIWIGLAMFATGVAGLVIAARRNAALEKAKEDEEQRRREQERPS